MFFLWTYFFFRCNQVSVEFWIYFGTFIFQSLVVLDLTHVGYLSILGVILDLHFFFVVFRFHLGTLSLPTVRQLVL